MSREDAAAAMGVSTSNLGNWESNRRNVSVSFKPNVYRFIGVCPYDASLSLGRRLNERREFRGLDIQSAATLMGVDPCTVAYWEREEHRPTRRSTELIVAFLKEMC